MPQLSDDMYCSQQICIPPMFPYVLRQYAKAAIRSQPPDLLRWSTAYFRCLALDIPPPVKPRLEYPVPRDYYGITPGWLKALMYQFQGNLTVSFRVLWDRWIGACLRHETLIQMLCLGAFTEPMAVPWLRFVGLCASFLTDNLTQTMILVCEILTEEPEGGSAMIPVETFNDIYKFLANIDGSKPQILLNIYFLDSFLGIEPEKPPEKEMVCEEEEGPIPELELEEEEAPPEEEEELLDLEDDGVISCPDIAADKGVIEPDDEDEVIMMDDDFELGKTVATDQDDISGDSGPIELQLVKPEEPEEEPRLEEQLQEEGKGGEEEGEEEEGQGLEPDVTDDLDEESPCAEEKEGEWSSKATLVEDKQPLDFIEAELHEKVIYIDLGMLGREAEGEEYLGEGGIFLEEKGIEEEEKDLEAEKRASRSKEIDEFEIEKFMAIEEKKIQEIYCEAIPGIGPIVPEEMVTAVCNYMLQMAKEQHGVVMPRNVRHYSCPPLEVIETN